MTRNALSTFAQRRKYIADHPELAGKPRAEVIKALKKAGLVSPKTLQWDVRIYRETGRDVPCEPTKP